jgi:hypothetical protein
VKSARRNERVSPCRAAYEQVAETILTDSTFSIGGAAAPDALAPAAPDRDAPEPEELAPALALVSNVPVISTWWLRCC